MEAKQFRSISPVGTSKFERPYTPSTYIASPTSPTSPNSVSWQRGRGHQQKPSLSAWSSTSDTNGDAYSYSTPTSSIYHTPISPAVKTFVNNEHHHHDTTDRDDQSGYSADDDEENEAANSHTSENDYHDHHSPANEHIFNIKHQHDEHSYNTHQHNEHSYHTHQHEDQSYHPRYQHNDHTTNIVQSSSPIDPSMEPEEWYARLDNDDQLADSYLGDECPDLATLATVHDIPIYDCDGEPHTFGSLYDQSTAVNQRQLIIFIRHFYCGACQAYVKAISESITIQDYFSIPIPTSIIIIGCGQPSLIPFYRTITGTKFPVFAEPSRQLYKKLGMLRSVNFGMSRPEYMRDISAPAWMAGQLSTIREGLRARNQARRLSSIANGFDMLQRRNTLVKRRPNQPAQTGAKSGLLTRKASVLLPRSTQYHEKEEVQVIEEAEEDNQLQQLSLVARSKSIRRRDVVKGGNLFQIGGEFLFEDGQVIWCHRMRHYRNHVEVEDIRKLMDLDP